MHEANTDTCFHCGLPLSKSLLTANANQPAHNLQYVTEISGVQRAMCCFGCLCAAQAIVDAGLDAFYSNRSAFSESPASLPAIDAEDLGYYDSKSFAKKYIETSGEHLAVTLIVIGISCTACAWLIEKTLRQLPGVTLVNTNAVSHRLSLKWQPELIRLSDIVKALVALGYRVAPYTPDEHEELIKQQSQTSLKRLGVAGLGSMQVMMFAVGLYAGSLQGIMDEYRLFLRYVSLIVATFVVFYAAWPFFLSAYRAIRKLHFNMDLPVSIAIGLAYTASVWNTVSNQGEVYFDSVCMFTFFLLITRHIEFTTRKKSYQNALSYSYSLPQRYALVDEQLQIKTSVEAERLQVGDVFQLKVGQTIPVDAVVVKGVSSVNEALITGEPLPLLKRQGDTVNGGSDNLEAPLYVRVLREAKDSTLFNIMRLIDRAQSEKPAAVQLADRVASVFVIAILLLAATVAAVWWQLDSSRMLAITLSVLVISCPCALSLATPSAMAAAISALARNGFLVTHGHTLETLTQLSHVVFDKTGTLTTGKFELLNTHLLSAMNSEQALMIAKGLEVHSEHPIAKVFIDLPVDHGQLKLSDIKVFPGCGVEGKITGQRYRIGKADFVMADDFFSNKDQSVNEVINKVKECDHARVFLADQKQLLAGFEIADTLRPDAYETIQSLKQRGIHTQLISGDSHSSALTLGNELGMDKATNNALPAEKVALIRQLQQEGAVVAMIGDGINDAPSLKAAQVSVAMGAVGEGADLAKTSADAVIMNRHLSLLLAAIDHAAKSKSIIRQNYSWAIIYNLSVLPLAAAGFVAPYWSAIGMSLSSLFVVLNSIRLIRLNTSVSEVPANRESPENLITAIQSI